MSKIRCTKCPGYLTIFEGEFLHGWQTQFYIKCSRCHHLLAEFPSSKPMDLPETSKYVNVPLPKQGLNEVTMRSVLSVHCSGFSWRDLHKFATIFDMPPPFERMPEKYLNKIEETVNKAAELSMQGATDELHFRTDSIPSPIPNCIVATVSFDSSWKTRGFYSNVGFGSAISATNKKVLDYVLFNRTCDKCKRWTTERIEEHPEDHKKWYNTHEQHCKKNYSGTSQSMEPEAAKLIWGRSIAKRKLCYTTFIGDGDSKAYNEITLMKPYDPITVQKEECITHVAKRLKKNLCTIKNNTANKTYVQCRLSEPKADHVSSNYSTFVIQNRGKSPATLSKGLHILLDHLCGEHYNCPKDTWCRWQKPSAEPPPSKTHINKPQEQAKVREEFETYASEDFCRHITLALTQNANESLHNVIWNFCPKTKFISPQSIHISTAIAVSIFNEGELCLYRFMSELNLNPTPLAFRSFCRREQVRQISRSYFKKANIRRRGRRLRLSKQRRETGLLKKQGKSYESSSFGAETFITPSKPQRIRGQRRPRRSATSRATTSRGKGMKRRLIPTRDSDESDKPEPIISDSDFSHSDKEVDDTTKDICGICNQSHPPLQRALISKLARIKWLLCAECGRTYHQRCTELDRGADVSSYICFNCI